MDGASRQFPPDPAERARLWREWISMDTPAVEARHVVRRSIKPRNQEEDWLPEVIDAPQAVLNGLSVAVRESMTGDQLTAQDRNRLISRAMRMGLSRFEANLLLAAVVHRTTNNSIAVVETPSQSRRPVGVAMIIAAALLLEAVAAATLWRWWMG